MQQKKSVYNQVLNVDVKLPSLSNRLQVTRLSGEEKKIKQYSLEH